MERNSELSDDQITSVFVRNVSGGLLSSMAKCTIPRNVL